MGNCASSRRPKHDKAVPDAGEGKYLKTLAARDQHVIHLQKQLEASNTYAHSIVREAAILRQRLWDLEENERQQQHNLSTRVLEDGTIIRPVVPALAPNVAEAIRQRLYEFLMWEKDEVVERCWAVEKEVGEREMGRRRIEEEVEVLRREVEWLRGRTPTPTPMGEVRERVLENIEAIRNGTWKGMQQSAQKRNATVLDPRDTEDRDPRGFGEGVSAKAFTTRQKTTAKAVAFENQQSKPQNIAILEEQLAQKIEAFTIQERLVESLIRERDELRTQLSNTGSRARNGSRSSKLNYAEASMSNFTRTHTSRGFGNSTDSTIERGSRGSIAPRIAYTSISGNPQPFRDPTDSAVEVQTCLDCEDLRAEIWCLSRSIEEERASAKVVNTKSIEAKEEVERALRDERLRGGMLLKTLRKRIRKVTGELSATKNELDEVTARLRRYKKYVREELLPAREGLGELSEMETSNVPSRSELHSLRTSLKEAHTRIVELAAAKEQAESKMLSQQRELRETRRLAMKQSRRSSGAANAW